MADLYLRDLVPIVELQALELKRLMRDKERLNEKVDSLIGEIGSLRQLQQQDQNLRAREQDLRAKMQQALTDLVSRSGQIIDKSPLKQKASAAPVGSKPAPAAKIVTDEEAAESAGKIATGKVEQTAMQAPERMEIPAFLASGPRVGFDRTVADDIREIHGPSRAHGEAPIKKLLARIRARNEAR